MNVLHLFAGAGGGILAEKMLGWKTVCAVEKDPYCQAVLLARQADGLLECFPIWDDGRTFRGTDWRGKVDLVAAGFPCQPFSMAGKRQGEADERNMWPDTIRIIREVEPRWCLLENVPGLVTSGYFGTVLRDLAQAGYDAEWDVFSAAGEGAPHLRERLWIVAHSQRAERGPEAKRRNDQNRDDAGRQEAASGASQCGDDVSDPRSQEPRRLPSKRRQEVAAPRGDGEELADSESFGRGKGRPQPTGFGRKAGAGLGGSSLGNASSTRFKEGECQKGREIWDKSRRPESGGRDFIADAEGQGLQDRQGPECEGAAHAGPIGPSQRNGRTIEPRLGGIADGLAARLDEFRTSWLDGTWEEGLPRVAKGVKNRVSRLKAIGNGQVPHTAVRAWLELSGRF